MFLFKLGGRYSLHLKKNILELPCLFVDFYCPSCFCWCESEKNEILYPLLSLQLPDTAPEGTPGDHILARWVFLVNFRPV